MNFIIKHRRKWICALLVIAFICFLTFENNAMVLTHCTYQSRKLPSSFNGYKIVQISDLHNKTFGKKQSKLISLVASEQPDMIAIIGDVVDVHRPNEEAALDLIKGLRQVAPIYYVMGNHEAVLKNTDQLKTDFESLGVTVLYNKKTTITKNNNMITVIGLDDPRFIYDNTSRSRTQENLHNLMQNEPNFTLLLSHRPELLALYAEEKVDLALTGHAHGGQIRLPLIGPIYAPHQGLFPQYTSGSYTIDATTEIVSRGLGNSSFPFRIFNRPEVVCITLKN